MQQVKQIMKKNYSIDTQISHEQWVLYFNAITQSYLSQSWDYGEAKKRGQRWCPMRGIVKENDQPIALFQAWIKSFGLFKVVRMSYGPLWLIESPNLEQIKGVFYAIKCLWNIKRGSILFVAPNLPHLSEYSQILTELRYYKRKTEIFESGHVDLTQPTTTLRKELRGNWRNQLTSAEKKELVFHASVERDDFHWLMQCFKQYRKEKKFYGHSIYLLEALFDQLAPKKNITICIVNHHQERVAGMLMADYGSACVPLVICMSPQGKKLNAGNVLFWNAMMVAKDKGMVCFDLGGTNGSTFKTGVPHEPYQMLGEYISFF